MIWFEQFRQNAISFFFNKFVFHVPYVQLSTFQSRAWCSPAPLRPGPLGEPALVFWRSASSTPASPAGPLSSTPRQPTPLLHSAPLPSCRPLFIAGVSFPHLQGGRVVTVGPAEPPLPGILHGDGNAPCWCRNLFLSLSPRGLTWYYFVVGCAVRYAVQR